MDFIVITGPTFSAAIRKIKRTLKIDAGIELRLDLFHEINTIEIKEILKVLRDAGKKVIFTLRSIQNGGGYKRSMPSLEKEIKDLATLDPDYMDIEWNLSSSLFDALDSTNIIASHHDFIRTPPSIERLLEKMMQKKAYAYKVCTTAQALSDSYRMINFIHKQKNLGLNIIGLCMGEKGKITRQDGLKVGNYLNYKIIHVSDKVAPGIDFP
ncbi:MAG: 3-dehydroquinate dehydratase [Chlamydiia bacterium]|nr:3-dehydroquinate dehydratase [Chlamydiia bacterium]